MTGVLAAIASSGGRVSVQIEPSTLYGSSTSGIITVGPATMVVVGGVGPFAYQWEYLSGSTQITADSPTSASSDFTGTGVPAGELLVTYFQGRVTDTATGLEQVSSGVLEVTVERLI